jgi:hypothetical protein
MTALYTQKGRTGAGSHLLTWREEWARRGCPPNVSIQLKAQDTWGEGLCHSGHAGYQEEKNGLRPSADSSLGGAFLLTVVT